MNNFNRLDSHGHHGSKRRKLVQHAHSHGSHAFTHILTWTQLQPRGAKRQLSYYLSVHAGSFRVSVIHRILTWTNRSLSCVRDHSCECVYPRGLGTPTASQHTIVDSEKLTTFSCAPGSLRPLDPTPSPTLYQLSHPSTFADSQWLTCTFRVTQPGISTFPDSLRLKLTFRVTLAGIWTFSGSLQLKWTFRVTLAGLSSFSDSQ